MNCRPNKLQERGHRTEPTEGLDAAILTLKVDVWPKNEEYHTITARLLPSAVTRKMEDFAIALAFDALNSMTI